LKRAAATASTQNLREALQTGVDNDKLTRALPWIPLAEKGKVFLVGGDAVPAFLTQAETFPTGISGVYQMLEGALPGPGGVRGRPGLMV
jgi:phage terminase large subunit-like protein